MIKAPIDPKLIALAILKIIPMAISMIPKDFIVCGFRSFYLSK